MALGVIVMLMALDFSAGFAINKFVGSQNGPAMIDPGHTGQTERVRRAVGKLTRRLQGVFSLAAAWATTTDLDRSDQRTVDDTVNIFLRGVRLERYLAEEHGVEPIFFWQPFEGSAQPGSPYQAAMSAVRRHGFIDLTHALDHPGQPVYLDGGHTNEFGARLVARAIYEHLRPRLVPLAVADE